MSATGRRIYGNGRARESSGPSRPSSLWRNLARGLGYLYALRDVAGDYLQLQAKRIEVRSRRAAYEAANRALGFVIAAAVIVTAVVLAIRGIAGALTEALGGRVWAGDLATAALMATTGAVAWAVAMSRSRNRSSRGFDEDEPC